MSRSKPTTRRPTSPRKWNLRALLRGCAAPAIFALLLVVAGSLVVRWSLPRLRQIEAAEQSQLLRSDRPTVQLAAADRLKLLGNEGIAVLAQALSDPRDDVFQTAVQAIDELLAEWRLTRPNDTAQSLHCLALALATEIDHLPHERRYVCRRWCDQIIAWPRMGKAHRIDELLAHCELVLRQSPVLTTVQVAASVDVNQTIDQNLSEWKPRPALPSENEIASDEPTVIELEPTPLESAGPSFDHRPVTRPEPSTAAIPPAEPQRLVATNAQPIPNRDLNLTRSPKKTTPPPVDEVAALRDKSDIEVMRHLHNLDIQLAKAAEVELRRRGYRTVDIPLCRALVHSDPSVRRQLAEQLPTLASIDPRPWLLQLSEDPDSEVRRTAEGILRTTNDPMLQRRFR